MTDTQLFQRDILLHNVEQALKYLLEFKKKSKHQDIDDHRLIENAITILKEVLE